MQRIKCRGRLVFRSAIPLVSFGKLEYVTVNSELIQSANYIDEDRQRPGNFIISNGNSLQFLSSTGEVTPFVGNPRETHIINGIGTNAFFSQISSFVHFTNDQLFLTDDLSGCVRHVNRTSAEVSYELGKCGFRDIVPPEGTANASEARFRGLSQIKYLEEENKFFILDYSSSRLMEYDRDDGTVTVLFASAQTRKDSYGFLFSSNNKSIFVSHMGGISKFDRETRQFELIAGTLHPVQRNHHSFEDGNLETARFGGGNHLEWLIVDQVLILPSYFGSSIRIVNLVDKKVTSMCKKNPDISGDYNNTVGGLDVCKIHEPITVKIINETIYFGSDFGLSNKRSGAFLKMKFSVPRCTIDREIPASVSPVKSFYAHNETVTLICPDNHVIVGAEMLTCVRYKDPVTNATTGRWSSPYPSCVPREVKPTQKPVRLSSSFLLDPFFQRYPAGRQR